MYQVMAYAGFVSLMKQMVTRFKKGSFWRPSPGQLSVYALAALGFGPFLILIVSNPNMYNGWRHSFFIYPFMVLLGLSWLITRFRTRWKWRWHFSTLLIVNTVWVLVFMVRSHPNQQTYFNLLAGKTQLTRYSMDYWGVSFRQGFELLGELDNRDTIYVQVPDFPGYFNYQMLSDSLQQRIIITENEDLAEYYLTHYWYWYDWREDYHQKRGPFAKPLVGGIKSGPNQILGIYKLK